MRYSEKNLHRSTGLDREYYDKWKSNPLYRKGNKLSKSTGSQSFGGLKALAKDNLAQFKRKTRNLGYVDFVNISGDSEDITLTFYFDDEDDFKNVKRTLSQNEKNLNQLPAFTMDYYSLENAVFRTLGKDGTYKVELTYCFDWDNLEESRKSSKGNRYQERLSKPVYLWYEDNNEVHTLKSAKKDFLYQVRNDDDSALEDFKEYGGDTKTWRISDENFLDYLESTADWGDKTGGAIAYKIFNSLPDLINFLVDKEVSSDICIENFKVNTICGKSRGIPESCEVDVSGEIALNRKYVSSYGSADEAEEDLTDALEGFMGGYGSVVKIDENLSEDTFKFEAIVTVDLDFIQTEGSY